MFSLTLLHSTYRERSTVPIIMWYACFQTESHFQERLIGTSGKNVVYTTVREVIK